MERKNSMISMITQTCDKEMLGRSEFIGIPLNQNSNEIDFSSSKDKCYDGISLIHLISSFSLYEIEIYDNTIAAGKVLVDSRNKLISGMMLDDETIYSVSIFDNSEESQKIRDAVENKLQRRYLAFLQKTTKEFLNNNEYLKSLLTSKVRWIHGHITELIMPDALFEKLLRLFPIVNTDKARQVHIFAKNILEQTSTTILLYETAISDLMATGEIDFFNNRFILPSENIREYIAYLIEMAKKNTLKLITGPLFPEFRHLYSPCLYISDTECYIRLEDRYNRDNIFQVMNKEVKVFFEDTFEYIFNNRSDLLIKESQPIIEKLEQYYLLAGLRSTDS